MLVNQILECFSSAVYIFLRSFFTDWHLLFQRTEEAAVDNAMGDQDSSDEEQVRTDRRSWMQFIL